MTHQYSQLALAPRAPKAEAYHIWRICEDRLQKAVREGASEQVIHLLDQASLAAFGVYSSL